MTLTSKQKIDQALGIGDGQSIDDFLNGLGVDDPDKLSSSFEGIKQGIQESISNIDQSIQSSKNGVVLEIDSLDKSMKEVEDLIGTAKQLFRHVYEQTISTSLIDAELVGSISKLLESIHINIAEFISLYRDRQTYVDKIRLKMIDHQNKVELLKLKYQLQKEANQKAAIDVTDNTQSYSYDQIVEMLSKQDADATKAEE